MINYFVIVPIFNTGIPLLRWWSLRISHIGVHNVYYETCALFSSTKSRIYDKEKSEQVKLVLLYKSVMDSNTFLFEPTVPKTGHSRVCQYQVASTYVKGVAQ